jgi:YtkA-like
MLGSSPPRRWLVVLLGAALTTFAVEASQACETPRGFETSRRLESSDVVVLFRTVPAPVEVGRHFTVEAVVCSRTPAPMPMTVRVDALMPEHRHGMNYRPSVVRGGDGVYVAEGLLFHMPGRWQLLFDVERGGRVERLSTDIELE